MMYYIFDWYGWYAGSSASQVSRCTGIAPANLSLAETPGALRANFTGYEWLDLPYQPPAPIPVPGPIVPRSVSMLNARLALVAAGLLVAADERIAAIDGTAGDEARTYWGFAHNVQRDHPLVATVAAALGKSDAEIDALFIAAGALP